MGLFPCPPPTDAPSKATSESNFAVEKGGHGLPHPVERLQTDRRLRLAQREA